MFEKNSRLSLHGRQAVLRKKDLNISCDSIRKGLLTHEVKFRSTMKKTAIVQKTRRKKIHLGKRKFELRLG